MFSRREQLPRFDPFHRPSDTRKGELYKDIGKNDPSLEVMWPIHVAHDAYEAVNAASEYNEARKDSDYDTPLAIAQFRIDTRATNAAKRIFRVRSAQIAGHLMSVVQRASFHTCYPTDPMYLSFFDPDYSSSYKALDHKNDPVTVDNVDVPFTLHKNTNHVLSVVRGEMSSHIILSKTRLDRIDTSPKHGKTTAQ